jgi:pyruvate dehydrogenase E1 component
MYAEQIRPWVKAPYTVLGTDGFGRSDTRERLRSFFEVDRYHVVVATLNTLALEGQVEVAVVEKAIKQYKINADVITPVKG